MNYTYIGKIVNTHGIKGEMRIISDIPYKKELYAIGNTLYIGPDKESVVIRSFRKHKEFDMLTFENINTINDVLRYKGESIYFLRNEIVLPGLIDEDYIGMKMYEKEKYIGDVTSVLKNKANDILVVENGDKKNLIPNIPNFIKKIDLKMNTIELESIEGLLNED